MLRRVFNPKFLLHDLRETGPNEITTRWTMNMVLALNKFNPFRRWWDPQLVFTGTSIMSINAETGKHDQHYASVTDVMHMLLSQFAMHSEDYFNENTRRSLITDMTTFSFGCS